MAKRAEGAACLCTFCHSPTESFKVPALAHFDVACFAVMKVWQNRQYQRKGVSCKQAARGKGFF
jgi:hypothetical protein